MDDDEMTRQLARALGVSAPAGELARLFATEPELVEWSINGGSDPRGTLRVSAWTRDRLSGESVFAQLASEHGATRERLLGDDFEGIGLALHDGCPASVRWWALTDDGDAMAERARGAWPDDAGQVDALLAAAGGPHTCTAVGLELAADLRHARHTVYARLGDPAAAIRVLELAAVPVTRAANVFWKGICGLEPGGRPWPKVWVGRSFGSDSGWKFYYFARGDELRRSDGVLLEAVAAGPPLRRAHQLLAGDGPPGPRVQLLGLTIRPGALPAFTVYLARS